MKTEYDFINDTVMPGVFMLLIIMVIIGIAYLANGAVCATQAHLMNLPFHFNLFAGCFVQYNGQYVPIESLRIFLGK